MRDIPEFMSENDIKVTIRLKDKADHFKALQSIKSLKDVEDIVEFRSGKINAFSTKIPFGVNDDDFGDIPLVKKKKNAQKNC